MFVDAAQNTNEITESIFLRILIPEERKSFTDAVENIFLLNINIYIKLPMQKLFL